MASLTEHMFDTSFVEEALAYLQETLDIRAWVVDSNGAALPLGPANPEPLRCRRLFSFQHFEEIGGLLCSATSEKALDRAEPHIRLCLTAIQQLLARETELQQTSAEMLQLSEQLNFLYHLASRISGVKNLQELYAVVLGEISKAIGAEQALLISEAQPLPSPEVLLHVSAEDARLLREKTLLPLRPRTVIIGLEDGRSALICPLKEKEGPVACMAFLRDTTTPAFTAYEKKFVSIIENIISPTTETMRLYTSLQEIYLNTVKALAAAIDAKDKHTHGHSFRVAKYSRIIGRGMGLDHKTLTDLEVAAYMHDLGKIGIPEAILGKPGALTPDEFEQIKKHPVFTDRILQPINLPDFIVDAAVHHHERLDGSGYPLGLQDAGISAFARIIAVADVFDAMTSERPYRKALSVEHVLRSLCDDIDTKFDRQVVLALIEAFKKKDAQEILAEINMNLNFASAQRLNAFLLEITNFLLDPLKLKHSPPPRLDSKNA